jgi:DNA repair protein SbcC/Rad50
MLKSIELWDFESHEHTLLDGLSDGLNVVCGPSNSGKTSVVRALRLVACNDFDPASVRIGAKNCRVRVTTDKGVVQVTRGKDNLWEVWNGDGSGPATHTLRSPGVAVVPQASEVIGIGTVKLGDVNVPVNIMEQLETHFMLAGIGDDKATGSVRAQVIDEISGLSGIESVIKAVSLDIHRAGREIKQSEMQMGELNEHVHDEAEIDRENRILDKASKHLDEQKKALEVIDVANDFLRQCNLLDEQVSDLKRRLAVIPNAKLAEQHIGNAIRANEKVRQAEDLLEKFKFANGEIERIAKSIARIPDHAGATAHLDRAREFASKLRVAMEILDEVVQIDEELDVKGKRLKGLSAVSTVSKHLDAAEQAVIKLKIAKSILDGWQSADDEVRLIEGRLEKLSAVSATPTYIEKAEVAVRRLMVAESILDKWRSADEEVRLLGRRIKDNGELLDRAISEQNEILKSIKVCPLNPAHPVSEDCLKGLEITSPFQ